MQLRSSTRSAAGDRSADGGRCRRWPWRRQPDAGSSAGGALSRRCGDLRLLIRCGDHLVTNVADASAPRPHHESRRACPVSRGGRPIACRARGILRGASHRCGTSRRSRVAAALRPPERRLSASLCRCRCGARAARPAVAHPKDRRNDPAVRRRRRRDVDDRAADRTPLRRVRGAGPARGRRHGRGLSGARHPAGTRRRDQDPPARVSETIANTSRASNAKRGYSPRSTTRTSAWCTGSRRSTGSKRW